MQATVLTLTLAALPVLVQPALAQSSGTEDEIAALKRELRTQQEVTRKLERRLDAVSAAQHAQPAVTQKQIDLAIVQSRATRQADLAAELAAAKAEQSKPAIEAGFKPGTVVRDTSGFQNGFYVRDASGDNTLYINGLLQPRFHYFAPSGTTKFSAKDKASSNFDDFLVRLYFSGNLIDPSLTYFITLQASSQGVTGGAPGIILLDGEIAKTFSPYLKVEMGRYWSAYTYEYFDDIGKYLFPDLSAAEWAFALGRQLGVRASGTAGDVTYRVSLSNPVPGSLSGATENTTTKLAVIGNLEWNILAPYGYMETDPRVTQPTKPELTLWASGMYNPVQNGSRIYNDVAGDNTEGATVSLNFRDGPVTFQGSGYYKHNDARGANAYNAGHPSFNSTGWQEQAGVYVVPGTVEVAERVDAITWGYRQTGPVVADAASDTQWYSGPDNFGWRHMTEYTAELNYYLHGHTAKAQLQYSYMRGSNYSNQSFDANRLLLQTQLAF
jgi:hypothetical protein